MSVTKLICTCTVAVLYILVIPCFQASGYEEVSAMHLYGIEHCRVCYWIRLLDQFNNQWVVFASLLAEWLVIVFICTITMSQVIIWQVGKIKNIVFEPCSFAFLALYVQDTLSRACYKPGTGIFAKTTAQPSQRLRNSVTATQGKWW